MSAHCRNGVVVILVAALSAGCARPVPQPAPETDAQQKEVLDRMDRIATALERLAAPAPEQKAAAPDGTAVKLAAYVPTPEQPVAELLKRIGVAEAMIESSSNWCECLEGVAHERRTAGAFVTHEGEKFPALAALPPPSIPPDNGQSLDERGFPRMDDPKVQLGTLLFFDTRLSGDNSVSCALCHLPDQGWGLTSAISRGYPGTSHWRNSQTVINSAYLWKLFWEGSALALEPQAKSANTGLSGNGKTDLMEERLRQVPEYIRQFKQVFGTDVPLLEDAWRAIAAFQRALNQPDTPFDRYMQGDKQALNESQIRGLALHQGKAGCIRCHNGPMFTDQKFYNTSVPQQEGFLEDPLKQITHRFQYYSKGSSEDMYRTGKFDLGLYFNTKRKGDIGKFRVPPLRYLAYTPPYMHNGVFDTLPEVVEFYNKGGDEDWAEKNFTIATKSKRMKPLNLTEQEQADLVAFLQSLSGQEIRMATPKLPDVMAYVYRGETYVGLPIPVTTPDPEKRQEPEVITWTLVEAPERATIDPATGRVTWPNAQPPRQAIEAAQDIPIIVKLRATTAKGQTTDQTLQVTVYRAPPPSVASITGAAQ